MKKLVTQCNKESLPVPIASVFGYIDGQTRILQCLKVAKSPTGIPDINCGSTCPVLQVLSPFPQTPVSSLSKRSSFLSLPALPFY
jgi:hypothetical protein